MAIPATRAVMICLGMSWPAVVSAQEPTRHSEAADRSPTQEAISTPQSLDPPPTELDDVEVVGTLPSQTDRIDRRVYNITRDPEAQSSTALEVIGRLPSVTVTASGNITLLGRGVASVLIDGKPVPNAEALRVLQGSDLDRVEVMTNPSAEFRAQGTGGVVNIITRRRRPIGLSGNVLASADTLENLRLSISTSTSRGKLTVTGNLSLEETAARQERLRDRETFSAVNADVFETSSFRQSGENAALGVTASYAFDDKRSLSWGGTVSHTRSQNRNAFVRTLSGPVSAVYDEVILGVAGVDATDANVEYSARSSDSRLLVKFSGMISSNDFFLTDEYIRPFDPSAPQELFGTSSRYATDKTSLATSLEYDGSSDLVLKAGFAFDIDSQLIFRLTEMGGLGDESELSGDIRLWSAYASVQWPLNGWTVMPGLRIERAFYAIDDAQLQRDEAANLFPSLHLRRPISQDWTVNLSYSRRVNRPDLGRLDPRPVYSSATDVATGSPGLDPEFTDALEARVEHLSGDDNASATLYHRITSEVWQPSFSLNSEQFVVQTYINAGKRANTGLELSLRRALSERFRLVATANLFHSEKDVLVGPVLSSEGSTEFNATLALAFKPFGSDPTGETFQWSLRYSGESRGYQTTTSAVFQSSFSWRRPVNDRLVSVLTISDLFDSGRQTFDLVTPEFRQRLEARGDGPQVRWTLAYRFGPRR